MSAQLLAAGGLSLSAPAAYAVALGGLDAGALGLWLLNAAFFLGAILHVRLLIDARARKAPLPSLREPLAFAGPTLALDAAILLAAAVAVRLGAGSPLVLTAFAAPAVHAPASVARLDRAVPLRRVGIVATVHAILFAALVVRLA